MTKKLTMLVTILLSLGVLGCSVIPVDNVEVCRERTRNTAKCGWTLGGPTRIIPADKWILERVGRPSISPKGFASLLKVIEKACLKVKCVIEEQDGVTVIRNFRQQYEDLMYDD